MVAVYIHWPFCISKCPYCDFNSHVGDTSDQERWRHAYRKELESYASLFDQNESSTPLRPSSGGEGKSHPLKEDSGSRGEMACATPTVTSIFFGGGTPSLMDPETVASVLDDIARLWPISPDVEITMEANPSSVEAKKFSAFRSAGVNRLSLGIQSLSDEALKFLGRAHNASEAKNALALAQKHFQRTSFDLIYGYKGQTLDAWKQELTQALSMGTGHISLYQLTIEPQTQFAIRSKKGEVLSCPEEEAAAMYELTQDATEAAGLPAYEISNHAKRGQESRHNLTYWRYEDYIGIGPGAHGRYRIGETRHAVENYRAPDTWLKQVGQRGRGDKLDEVLDLSTAMREAVLMGLRLTEGIDLGSWQKKFPTLLSYLPASKIARLESEGLMDRNEKALRATNTGLQRLNAILEYLLI